MYPANIASNDTCDLVEHIKSCITLREKTIDRLRQIVTSASRVKPVHLPFIIRDIVSLSSQQRDIGLKIVNSIVLWSLESATEQNDEHPPVFHWNDCEDYLVKMYSDLNFIMNDLYFSSTLASHGSFSLNDPFCLKKLKFSEKQQQRAAIAATLVILDAVIRKEKRTIQKPLIRQNSYHTPKSILKKSSSKLDVMRRSVQAAFLVQRMRKYSLNHKADVSEQGNLTVIINGQNRS